MKKEKIRENGENQKESKRCVIWSGADIAETVILSILAAVFIAGGIFLYLFNFKLNDQTTVAIIQSFSAPLIIAAVSYLLFFSYRILGKDGRKWLKAILNLVYLGLIAGILYFNWYNCKNWFDYKQDGVLTQVIRHIMWANSVSCGVSFLLYYSVLVYVREWNRVWDVVMTVFMMTFVPILLIVGFVVASFVGVMTAIMLPGKIIDKSVQSDLASRSSKRDYRGDAYTVRNSSGYEETAYSTDGHDFYGSDGSYMGHKD